MKKNKNRDILDKNKIKIKTLTIQKNVIKKGNNNDSVLNLW